MKRKRDTKFGEEMTCCFRIDVSNLANFDLEHPKVSNVHFNGLLLSKGYIV